MLRRLAKLFGMLVLLFIVVTAGALMLAGPRTADDFYSVPLPADAVPGTLLRFEPLTRAIPDGAKGWRILYVSTRPDGKPAVASGVVVASLAGETRPVIGYAHGTSGIATGCAPSLFDNPFPNVPGFPALLEEGWAFVAPDYVGLGTDGGHFYLVGQDAGRALLDALRAAEKVDGIRLAARTVLWGHSQGGHAALWAGQIAADYAPEIAIEGIGALAPATNLPALMAASASNPFEKVVSSYLAAGYADAYPEDGIRDAVRLLARPGAGMMARYCVDGSFASLVPALLSFTVPRAGVFRENENNLAARLEENIPRGPFDAPVLVGQGVADDLVRPEVQEAWAQMRCDQGVGIDFRRYAEADHVSVTAPGGPAVDDLISWSRDRFDRTPVSGTCLFD